LLDTLRTIEAADAPNVYHFAIVASYIAYLARELPNPSLRDAAFSTVDRIPWTVDLSDMQFSMRRAVAWRHALDGDDFNAFRELKRSAESAPTPAHRVVATCDRATIALALGEPRWAAQETRDASEAADRIDWRTVAGEERFGLCLLAELLAPRDAALALSYLARYRADGPRFARTLSSADDVRVGALEAYSFGVVRAAAGDLDEARRLLRESFEAYRSLGYRWRAARAALALAHVDDGPMWREQAAQLLVDYPRSFLAASLGGAVRGSTPVGTFAEAERLTRAQRTIFDLVVQGLPTSEIARAVGRSEFTVKNHLKAIFKTCDVRSRAALIAKVNSAS
jgi:DNA-binding NarL/FixJ family response regulator